MLWVCHWCGEKVQSGRKFCCQEHREMMKRELLWYDTPTRPFPRYWIRQYIVKATCHIKNGLQPWNEDRFQIRGFQKRTFLHE